MDLKTKETIFETLEHVHKVQRLLAVCICDLHNRAHNHDRSKIFSEEELKGFANLELHIHNIEFGTPSYTEQLANLEETLEHHYRENRHHPEHFENGINDMTLVDLLEMVTDWMASTTRSKDGDIRKSLAYEKDRFGISEQLLKVIENTIDYIEQQSCLHK